MRHDTRTWTLVMTAALLLGLSCSHVGKDALMWEPDGGDSDTDTDTDTDTDSDTGTAFDCEGDGVWLDEESGLCWQDPPDDTKKELQAAIDDCDGLVVDGYDDWRMPNIDELRSLVRGCPATELDGDCQVYDGSGSSDLDDSCNGCSDFGGPGEEGCYWDGDLGGVCNSACWSSSISADNEHRAWVVFFKNAKVIAYIHDEGAQYLSRCVRDGY